ncbi:MAG: MoaD/ThiS family protein [Caldisphaeraceae archaeon]|nr:MoaD/ThiS family protein [Caldisphaeraceae archaeon]MEB3691620.1 MoaD/ThiS family protein [Caldisphaeraceae archaeon]MEB3798009.1 MoaD/ThiS family protein [Caldisphaeraceae archaeon]
MKVKIKYLGFLSELAGKRYEEKDIEGEETIEKMIPFLNKLKPEDYVLIINGKGASPKTKVSDGDYVVLLPQTGGGNNKNS